MVIRSAAKDSAYAALIFKNIKKRIDNLQMELGVYPVRQLEITILPNRSEYMAATSGKGKIVESSLAFYSPGERIIYVRSPEQMNRQPFGDVLMHEYIHWFLDETLFNVPLWFHEGMAMFYSGQFGFQAYYDFTRYRFMGYKISLNDMISSYPENKSYWNMFYLTSVFAVNYMQSRFHDQWLEFWNQVGYNYSNSTQTLNRKTDFVKAFNYAYHKSMFAFSRDYDKLLLRYSWQFPFIGINAVILSLLPFVIIIGWLKSRKKLKSLPEDENNPDDVVLIPDNLVNPPKTIDPDSKSSEQNSHHNA